jgi:hypothetical protein
MLPCKTAGYSYSYHKLTAFLHVSSRETYTAYPAGGYRELHANVNTASREFCAALDPARSNRDTSALRNVKKMSTGAGGQSLDFVK